MTRGGVIDFKIEFLIDLGALSQTAGPEQIAAIMAGVAKVLAAGASPQPPSGEGGGA